MGAALTSPFLLGTPPVRARMRQLLNWWVVLRYGTTEEREALVARLSEKDLKAAASTLDVSDAQMHEWIREGVRDCARLIRAGRSIRPSS